MTSLPRPVEAVLLADKSLLKLITATLRGWYEGPMPGSNKRLIIYSFNLY